jgi:hypothetical protein
MSLRTASRTIAVAALVSVASIGAVAPAFAAPGNSNGNGAQASRKANFAPLIYADGKLFGTNLNGDLPAPTAANAHSYDALYVLPGQMPVAEAAPGPDYNGGRWSVVNVAWAPGVTPVLVTSEDTLLALAAQGKVTLTEAGVYFSCPLLPVKG